MNCQGNINIPRNVHENWVFPQSMNRDKAQNWNGYQEYAMSSNSNILRWSSKNNIFTTMSG